jgi:HK97 family phage major capsid protein
MTKRNIGGANMASKLKVLRDQKADLIGQARSHLDSVDAVKGMTEEQKTKADAFNAQIEQCNSLIAAEERLQEQERSMPAIIDPNAAADDAAKKPASKWKGPGEFMAAVHRATVAHQIDPRLIQASLGANETVATDGGFLVGTDVAPGLLTRAYELARIADRAQRVPISAVSNGIKINALKDNSRATGSRWGGIQMYWIGEGDTITPTRPKFRQMELNLKKIAGLLYATDEMMQDQTALGSILTQAYPSELAFMLDDAMFEGSGAGTPLGIMNSGGKITVAKEVGQAAATIVYENIQKMWSRMWSGSWANSEWWINQDCMPQLNAMSLVIGTGGIPVYLPPGGLSQSPFGTLMGRPVRPLEYCNTLGTAGDIVLADPTQYVMIDKGDIQYATSIHVAFLTAEQAFRFIYRVDGQPVDNLPITPFKGTATQSPFVLLATRA